MNTPSAKEALFFAALEQPTAADRAAFLDDACGGNADLRRQVDRLLASHERAGGFLERPVQEVEAHGTSTPNDTEQETAADGEAFPLHFLAPSPRADAIGRLGHYDVLQVLGSGATGVVLRAFDEKLHRVVAIKVLAPALAAVGPARRRFVREARSAAAVIHDNVVAVHAVEDGGPIPFLVMAYVSGPTLQQKVDAVGPLPVVEILRLGMQAAAGLAAAHAQGLVHRDVKPSNILLENGVERAKITDFGLARTADEPAITHAGVIAGTPAYMSPEQANGDPVGPRSDLFSLGSVLYAMCAGQPPFRAKSMVAVLKQVCDATPPPVRDINPDIPDWLEGLIATLHAKDPAARPESAAAVSELLGQRLAEWQQPTAVRRAAPPPAPPPARRAVGRGLIAVAVAVLLLFALGASEATGVTNVRGVVVRLWRPDGTLVVEVDDPAVSVTVDDTDLVVTGAGAREIRLKPGAYQVRARKDGQTVQQELVTVDRAGRRVVRIAKEDGPATAVERWERDVAALPADEQVREVVARLQKLNPAFDGKVTHRIDDGKVVGLQFETNTVTDVSPVRALRTLKHLVCRGPKFQWGRLSDLTPLRGLRLTNLECDNNPVTSLEPLRGMPLINLNVGSTTVGDLSPLAGMRLTGLSAQSTRVTDLTPLQGMPLVWLDLYEVRGVTDLRVLKGMSLTYLNLTGLRVTDVSLLADLKTLEALLLDDMPLTDLNPLRGLKVKELSFRATAVDDLTPVRDMPLKSIRLDVRPDRVEFLRSFPDLRRINDKPADEVLKAVTAR